MISTFFSFFRKKIESCTLHNEPHVYTGMAKKFSRFLRDHCSVMRAWKSLKIGGVFHHAVNNKNMKDEDRRSCGTNFLGPLSNADRFCHL